MIAAAPCLSAVSKIKNTYWKNGWPVIHFGSGETNQPPGHPNGYPLIQLSGNPYNQPSYFKNVRKIMKAFKAAVTSCYRAAIVGFVAAVPPSVLVAQATCQEH